jgi:ATP-binding cassette subfamily B protein
MVLIMAAEGVVAQQLSLGDMIMIQALLLQLFMPLGSLGIVYRQIKHNFIDMNNMFNLLDKKPKIKSDKNAPLLKVGQGKIEFKNVTFAYSGKESVLKDISFDISPGQKVAIVGASGSGKSTLAKLLFRFYDVESGEILIDGQNIKQLDLSSVQKAIGVVPQDTVMFNESIYYNIAYGKQGATSDEVKTAAKLAFIDQFIEQLPQGYDSRVGERGLKLSGGEKQRLAIARVLLKNPPILIFDEATSALDSYSEQMVQRALNSVGQQHTTLVIAHRLSTIVDSDKIIVLGSGGIQESGSHEELLKAQGEYAKLWDLQIDSQHS